MKKIEQSTKSVTKALYQIYDKETQSTQAHTVLKETDKTVTLDNNQVIKKADLNNYSNISKNRFNIYEDRKSYQSHVDYFKDVHEMYLFIKDYTIKNCADVKESQYFVTSKSKQFKARIQDTAVEFMSAELETYDKAFLCTNKKDELKYMYTVKCNSIDELKKALDFILQ